MTNNVTLIGRLTKAIDIKATNSGTTVGNFTLAVNRTFGRKEQEADFITYVGFNKAAEIISQYTDKGSQIAVVDRIQTRNYENKEGVRIYVTEVVANQVQLLDSKGSNNGAQGQNNDSYTQAYGGQTRGTQPPQNAPEDNPFANQDGAVDVSDQDLPF